MILKQLEIHGFKSFAERTVLDFNSDSKKAKVTGIVGPNGSGKSNVVDAIRWVLGEQSYKLMRSKKSEDVVFFGSAKKSKGSAASVSITLDNANQEVPIDFSEVTITRKVYGNGEGEYFINKSKVRLIDVQELLSKCGFGQTTYTVLGQGMVDQLLFYGPAERKVLFEEAAGVKKYQIKRDQSIKKLEATDQNIIRMRDILSELSPRLSHLKKQVKKAEEREDIEREYRDLIHKYYSYKWHNLDSKIHAFAKNKTELEKEKSDVESELKEIDGRLKGDEKKSFEDIEKFRAKYRMIFSERDTLKERHVVLSGSLRVEEERESTDGGRLEEEKNRKENLIHEISAKIQEREKEISVIKKELAVLMKEISAIQTKILEAQSALKENNDAPTNLLGLKKEFQSLSEKQEDLIKILNDSKDLNIETAKKKALEISNLFTSFWEKVRNLNKKDNYNEDILKVEKLSKEKDNLLNSISEIRIKISSSETSISNFNEQKKALEWEIERVAEKLENLEKNKTSKDKIQNINSELQSVKLKLEKKEKELEDIRSEINQEEIKGRQRESEIYTLRSKYREKQMLIDNYNNSIRDVDVEIARVDTRREDLKDEILREIGNLEEIKNNIVNSLDEEQTEKKIYNLRNKLASIGGVDEDIEEEYKEIEERHGYLSTQITDLDNAKDDLHKIIKELDGKIKKQFNEAFSEIAKEFKKYFTTLFDGGQADLALNYSEEEGEKTMGIEIQASPPGKRIKNLNALSGGERTLTSLALLFAILSINPSPFVVLDEVDAALDETNTSRFLKIVEDISSKTQFIIVTHNKETMKIAGDLYGVTMDDNHVSKILSLRLSEVEAVVR